MTFAIFKVKSQQRCGEKEGKIVKFYFVTIITSGEMTHADWLREALLPAIAENSKWPPIKVVLIFCTFDEIKQMYITRKYKYYSSKIRTILR